jgi:hypothetical protein
MCSGFMDRHHLALSLRCAQIQLKTMLLGSFQTHHTPKYSSLQCRSLDSFHICPCLYLLMLPSIVYDAHRRGNPILSDDRRWFPCERSVLTRELHVAYVRGSPVLSDDRQWFPLDRSSQNSLEDRPKLLGHCSNRAKWAYKAILQAKSLPVCHFNRLSHSYDRKLPVTLAPLFRIHSTSLP